MGNGLGCGRLPGDFRVPKFQSRNLYPRSQGNQEALMTEIIEKIAPMCQSESIKDLANFITYSKGLIFQDPHFEILDSKILTSNKLSKLYDFKRQKIDRLYRSSATPLEIINQPEIELAYSSAVFYLLCKNSDLKQTIILTRQVNSHHAYVFQLHCNGVPCLVAVDDSVPVQKDRISYMNVVGGKELWPLFLEKAWVKQIGSYSKAKGLSPEDCFEEVTGIPAYSIVIKEHFHKLKSEFKEAMSKNYWVALTGYENEREICSHQIFIIEDMAEEGNMVKIRSPYQNFQIDGHNSSQGVAKVELAKIRQLFEFATIGCYTHGHQTSILPITSRKNEEVVVEVTVHREEELNIRFQQFYEEYLEENEKEFYVYSPVLMELYDSKKQLMLEFEGIPESRDGVRSSHFCQRVMASLVAGKYYLRLQVSWVNENQLNSGTLVSYSSAGNVEMSISAQKDHNQLSRELILGSLQGPSVQSIFKEEQGLKVRWLEKQHSYLLSIENTQNDKPELKISFKDSQNISINHHPLQKDKTFSVRLGQDPLTILEIVPEDPHKEFYLASFQIVKI